MKDKKQYRGAVFFIKHKHLTSKGRRLAEQLCLSALSSETELLLISYNGL
jgi:hypothetical protein